jgi:hypothetical protein
MKHLDRRSFLRASLGALVAAGHFRVRREAHARPRSQAASPQPAAVQAQGVSESTVELIWMAVAGASAYRVYRDGALVAEQPGTLLLDSGLAAQTSYAYQVAALLGGAEQDRSAPCSVTTQATRDLTPPGQPGPISVSQISASTAQLSWAPSQSANRVCGYRVLRGAPGGPPASMIQLGTTDALLNYSATSLRAQTAYAFAVLAVDINGSLSAARTVTFTTLPSGDSAVPEPPPSASVTVKAFSATRLDVVWGVSPSPEVASYQVFRDGVLVGEVERPLRRYFSDNGLTADTSYVYTIRAISLTGVPSALTSGRNARTLPADSVVIVRGPMLQRTTGQAALVTWWTNLPAPSLVRYGAGALADEVFDPVPTRQHAMLVGSLSPGTLYSYQVISGAARSAQLSLTTAPASGAAFAFAAVGDFGGGSVFEAQVAANIAAGGTQFVQTVGDNVYPDAQDPDPATTYSDFDARFYKQYGPVLAAQTLWPALGNKEYYGDGAVWRNFWMLNNRIWYSYDWGDLHMLVLDTEHPLDPGSPQHTFAEADLQAAQDARWRVVVVHRPPYSSSSANASSSAVRSGLVPLFEQQHVQLVLSGNSHNYERSWPLRSDAPHDGGVTYMVTGGGGNGLNQFVIGVPAWSAFRQAVYQHLRVDVSPEQLRVTSIGADGVIVDTATILAQLPAAEGQAGGVVTDAYTGRALAGALVSTAGHSTLSDSAGGYTLAGLAPGTITLTASLSGYAPESAGVTIAAGQHAEHSFALEVLADPARSGAIFGTVEELDSGAPIAGAELTCAGLHVTSDAAGAYRFASVPSGPHTLVASALNYRAQSRPVSVVAGGEDRQDFAMEVLYGGDPALARLSGMVVDGIDGEPLGGASLRCGDRAAVADAYGRFEIVDLAPGAHTLEASAAGYVAQSRAVELAAGAVTDVYVALLPIGAPGAFTIALPLVVVP